MFAFLFLLMNYYRQGKLNAEERRACEMLRHNWVYHRENHDTWTDYLQELNAYNEKSMLKQETNFLLKMLEIGLMHYWQPNLILILNFLTLIFLEHYHLKQPLLNYF